MSTRTIGGTVASVSKTHITLTRNGQEVAVPRAVLLRYTDPPVGAKVCLLVPLAWFEKQNLTATARPNRKRRGAKP